MWKKELLQSFIGPQLKMIILKQLFWIENKREYVIFWIQKIGGGSNDGIDKLENIPQK